MSYYKMIYNYTETEKDLFDFACDPELNKGMVDADKIMSDLSVALQEKTDAVVGYQNSLEDYISLIDAKIKDLQLLKRSTESKRDRFEGYVTQCLDLLGVKEVVGKLTRIALRKPSKVLEIIDEDKIPLTYLKREEIITIDKVGIKKAITNGDFVDGVQLVNGKRSITFKNGKVNNERV